MTLTNIYDDWFYRNCGGGVCARADYKHSVGLKDSVCSVAGRSVLSLRHRLAGCRIRNAAPMMLFLLAAPPFAAAQSGVDYGGDNNAAISRIEHPLHVSADDGLVTLIAGNVPLSRVLEAIGLATGIEVSIKSGGETLITIDLAGVPIEDAVERLLRDGSYSIFYTSPTAQIGVSKVVRVEVFRVSPVKSGVTKNVASIYQSNTAKLNRRAVSLGLDQGAGSGLDLFHDLVNLAEEERRYAMHWLSDIRDYEAIAALKRFLALDESPVVRREAAIALGGIGDRSSIEALKVGLGDENPVVRHESIEALGEIAPAHGDFALGQVIFGERDAEMRASAVRGLGRARTPAARKFLLAALNDPNPEVRKVAEDQLTSWDFDEEGD